MCLLVPPHFMADSKTLRTFAWMTGLFSVQKKLAGKSGFGELIERAAADLGRVQP